VCVLDSVVRHSVFTALGSGAMCANFTVYRGTVCVVHSLESLSVCTAQCRELLCVYCTV